jgi:hypothetical protein
LVVVVLFLLLVLVSILRLLPSFYGRKQCELLLRFEALKKKGKKNELFVHDACN